MTFKDIAIKNFKGNIKKYLIYFLGNSFIVASYFIFFNILENWNGISEKIEEGVSEGFIIPIATLTIFTVVFIFYSHTNFINQRKKEFGIFMNLGMSINNIRKLIIIENIIIAVISIITGLIVGGVFSRFLYLILLKIIDVDSIQFSLTIQSFIYSIVIFLVLNLFSLIATVVATNKFNIINLLKSHKKIMGRNKNSISTFILGVSFVGIAIFLLYRGVNGSVTNSNSYVLSGIVLIYSGLFLVISNVGAFLLRLLKKNKKIYYKNLLCATQIDSKFKENKYIIFITTILISISIFYSGSALTNYNISERLAIERNTYDITFYTVEDRNNINKEKVDELIKNSKIEITEYNEVEILYYHGSREKRHDYVLISENELREKFNENIQVPTGTYKRLIQFGESINEDNPFYSRPNTVYLGNDDKKFECKEIIYKKLFRTENNGVNDIVILNSNDYKNIYNNTSLFWKAKIRLFNTSNWKDDNLFVNKLRDELNKYDSKTFYDIGFDMQDVLKVRSKIGSFRYNKQVDGFMIFTCGYLGLFFFCAISIILFIKLMADSQGDKERYRSVYKIGVEDRKVKKIIYKELRPIYFLGLLLGGIIGVILTICLVGISDINMVKASIKDDVIMLAIYFAIQVLYYIYSRNKYYNYIRQL